MQKKVLLGALLAGTVLTGVAHSVENWVSLGQGPVSTWFINSDISTYGSAKRADVKSVPNNAPPLLNGQKVLYNITTVLVDCRYSSMQQIASAYYGESGMLQKQETPLGPGHDLIPLDKLSAQHKSIYAWVCNNGQFAQAFPPASQWSAPSQATSTSSANNSTVNPDAMTHPEGSLMTEQQVVEQAGTAVIIMDYSTVAAGNDFPVRIRAVSKIEPQTSYMYLVPASLPHKNEKLAEQKYLTYHNVGEMQHNSNGDYGTLIFDAPSQPGQYDLRMFDRGEEISTVTFAVGGAAIKNFNPGGKPE